MCSPTIPEAKSWMPEKNVMAKTVVCKPGVRLKPRIFWSRYHPPRKKLDL
jgi:hypothetical protein